MADPQPEGTPRRHESRSIRCDWYPDVPDHRDYLVSARQVTDALSRLRKRRSAGEQLEHADAREYVSLSPLSDSRVPSSVEAIAALIEHFERRASGRFLDLSRGFLNCASERCAMAAGGVVTLRTVLKAARRCGVPSERYFPSGSGSAPDALSLGLAHNLKTMRYFRLDSPSATSDETLRRVKAYLIAGFPTAFGFAVSNAESGGEHIWSPSVMDDSLGGTAAIALGFDDHLRIRSDKGALLIRGIWRPWQSSPEYGWLPYSFVRRKLASDFWTLLSRSWIRSGEFSAPAGS